MRNRKERHLLLSSDRYDGAMKQLVAVALFLSLVTAGMAHSANSHLVVGQDASMLPLKLLQALTRQKHQEIASLEKKLEREHAEWKELDRQYRKAEGNAAKQESYHGAITLLKEEHAQSHVDLEKLQKGFAKYEAELAKRHRLQKIELQAESLLENVRELRQKAEEIEKERAGTGSSGG